MRALPIVSRRRLFAMRAQPIVSCRRSLCVGRAQMYRKYAFFVGVVAAGCFVAETVVAPSVESAKEDPLVTKSMESLKAMTGKLRAPSSGFAPTQLSR